jgi:hypothetical protein
MLWGGLTENAMCSLFISRVQSIQVLWLFFSGLNWDPTPADECVLPPLGEGHTRLRDRGVGGSQFGRGDRHCGTRLLGSAPKVNIYRVLSPLAMQRLALPPNLKGDGHTRLRARGWESPNSDDWRKSLALCLLCEVHFVQLYTNSLNLPWTEAEFMNVQVHWGFGHNLESSQTWGFCMDFFNHREGGVVLFQFFLLSPLQKL